MGFRPNYVHESHQARWETLQDTIASGEVVANLYQYWLPGVEPPSFDDAQPEEAAAPATSDEGGEELSAAAQRVPAHLLERSKAAKERWAAKNG